MVIEAAEVVPGQDDDGVLPSLGVHDGIDGLDAPVLARAFALRRVIASRPRGRQPGKWRQPAMKRILEEVSLGHHVGLPLLGVTDVADGIQRRPYIAELARRLGIVSPGNAG